VSSPSTPGQDAWRILVDSIRDYAIFMLDRDGLVRTWNAGARLIKGYHAEEIIGHSIERFYTPEARAEGRPARLLQIAATQGRVEDEGWRLRKDGARFWADVVITALRSPDGELIGFAKVTRDLTERRAAEERLRQGEERFRLLVDAVKDYAIFMLEPTGVVATWNPGAERLKGYRPEEIIGQHFSRFYEEADVRAGKCEMELEVAAREGRFQEEGWRVRKDGTRFWASVVLSAMRDDAGALIGFAKVTRDLTERRISEEERVRLAQAHEAIRLRDEFVSIASHELRTPLAALSLQLESLEMRLRATDPQAADRLIRAANSAGRLNALVESMLDVSRMATGKFTLAPSNLDLTQLVATVVDQMSSAADAAGCQVRLETRGPVPGCWDHMRIEQVLMNLLSNAFKYGAGHPVDVVVARDGDEAVLQVLDSGPGIPEEAMARIFGRFERAASMSHYGGLGVGLYVAREVAVAHGGTIEARNRQDGGTCLTVRLPLAYHAPS
jgi:PAS domain S-box-containing protein